MMRSVGHELGERELYFNRELAAVGLERVFDPVLLLRNDVAFADRRLSYEAPNFGAPFRRWIVWI